jgi:hypothetical protein
MDTQWYIHIYGIIRTCLFVFFFCWVEPRGWRCSCNPTWQLVNVCKKRWKDPPSIGKSTISMAIFNSYVKLLFVELDICHMFVVSNHLLETLGLVLELFTLSAICGWYDRGYGMILKILRIVRLTLRPLPIESIWNRTCIHKKTHTQNETHWIPKKTIMFHKAIKYVLYQ